MRQKILLILFASFFVVRADAAASWFDGRPTTFAALTKQVKPAVVNISTTTKVKRPSMRMQTPFGGQDPFEEFRRFFEDAIPREETQHALGTGFVINAAGDILTNNHVVGDADEILVRLADGRKFKATVVGRDATTDLAVIKIKAKDPLPFVTLGDSDAAEQGDWVMAVGNPFGFEHTVTVGVISAKGRVIGDARAPFAKFIQTDASINPGNSGGPLFNLNGEVIGINTMIYGMGTGIGFAIPSNLAKTLIPQLLSKGSVTRGWLGVQIQRLTPELAESYGLETERGALIGGVSPGSPAAQGGLQRGDLVLEYDGKRIEDPFDLSTFVSQTPVGKTAILKVLRAKKEITLNIKIGKREEEGAVAQGGGAPATPQSSDVLGLFVRDLSPREQEQLGGNKGVVIDRVEPGSNAEGYDVREGDVLYEINGKSVTSAAGYQQMVKELKKGSMVRLLIGRGSMTIYIAFKI